MKNIFHLSTLALILIPAITFAHPGRTDSSGCHTCKTNCSQWGLTTGEYHCHAPKGVPQPLEPVKSTRNESGVGVTVPAPEYAAPKVKPPVIELKKKSPVTPTPQSALKTEQAATSSTSTPAIEHPSKLAPTTPPTEKDHWIKRFFKWFL